MPGTRLHVHQRWTMGMARNLRTHVAQVVQAPALPCLAAMRSAASRNSLASCCHMQCEAVSTMKGEMMPA